uniref:Leucine rich repeats and IQ motif containing 1 n=1 Tax=Anser brachyrhynchus TaxID=132585 RepID=A0A8B9I5R7_9AVES
MSEDIERIEKEIEIELGRISVSSFEADDPNTEVPEEALSDTETVTDVELSISLTYPEIEEKCRQELEQWEKRQTELEDEKRKKWKAEREAQEKENEEEHARRVQRLEEFESERMELELLRKKQQTVMEDELQKEKKSWRDKMMQHEELIMKLQLQMEEEKKASEEQKEKERKRLAEQRNTAAVKIQARFRTLLVRKKYVPILKEWKDKIQKAKKAQEENEREIKVKEEKMKRRMEERSQKKEEEKRRQGELEREKYLEQVRRREEYEKKKASLRLEREKQLQIRREEQRRSREKIAKAMMTETGEDNKESIKEEQTENRKVIIEEKKELKKQIKEQKVKQTELMDETNNWMIPTEGKLTPTNMLSSEKKEDSSQVNNENIYMNSVICIEENYSQTRELNKASGVNTSKHESVDFGATDVVENTANDIRSSPSNIQSNADNREVKDKFYQSGTTKISVFLVEDANKEVRENWDTIQEATDHSNKLILPDDIEKKRINWMNTCKSWSKIYEENKRKKSNIKKRPRKTSVSKMLPLSIQKIMHSGPWSTLQQVTELTLEDLPACSLSTLSECSNLQVLTLRRCGLVALDGLSSCKDLKYINVEENSIEMIDCENLENLCILILNKNRISSVCGLDGCINLQNLELSYNRITRIGKKINEKLFHYYCILYVYYYVYVYYILFHYYIAEYLCCLYSGLCGLESLKNLQQLNVDHNQLISTKGLCEAPTLIHLDCSFNHLTQIEGIESCGLLQILKLQGNNLQELPRLENHVLLRELYLDDNSISAMKMLSLYWLPLLQIVSLSQNSLTELVPLNSFVSLEKLDIKNNCLSDLKSVIAWLSGCSNLRELSLSGNPLLQERNCKPSLCKELPSLQFLDGENLNYHTLPTTERIKRSESRTFLELCQVQIEENQLIEEIYIFKVFLQSEMYVITFLSFFRIASSIDAAQRQCWYFNQLMKLSIEHRCAHEYGELNITDRDRPETLQNHLKQTSTGCLQENNLFIMGATENKQVLLDPSERWITPGHIKATFINSSIPVHQKENKEDHRVKQKNTESCINYSEESKGNNNMSAQLTLLHMAASAIQSLWKKYHARTKTNCTKTRNDHFTEVSGWKNEAATLIQASWKGFLLRRKLASALAAVKSDEVEDDYEEINVDDFMFYEAALEKEWLTLDSTRFPSKTLLFSNQLRWPKVTCHSNFLLFCLYSFLKDMLFWDDLILSEIFSELFSSPRGFKDISTAQLMLKRAHKMKPRKYSNKKVDPAVRLALFKNNENKHLHVKPPRKTLPANAGYFEGEKEEFSQLDTTLDEKLQRRKDFTYQWLHTQLSDYETASSKNTKSCSFFPELDPVAHNSGQVQLVASPVSREDTDLDLVSMASGSALTKSREKNKQPHRHSARSSSKLWAFSITVLKVTLKYFGGTKHAWNP